MPNPRILIFCLILILSLTMSSLLAQESTEDAEETEVASEAPTEETTAEPTSEATEESDEEETDGTTYVVVAGDNLFRIALRHNLTTAQLAAANGITNPNLIYVGQRLTIPASSNPSPTPTPSVTPTTPTPEVTATATVTPTPDTGSASSYTVVAGDNLYRIALRNNTTIAVLVSLNNIANPNLIFVGQRLNLPSGSPDSEEDEEETPSEATEAAEIPSEIEGTEFASGIEIFLEGDVTALVSQASQLNLTWVKITVDWAEIEATEGEIDFAELDAAVDAFSEAGFQILLTLTGAPDWSRPSATDLALQQPTYGPPDDLDDFGTFAGAVAEHYAGKVQAYEIWYQPNNRLSWMTTNVSLRSDGFPDARLSNVRYIDLLEVAYEAIKDADSDAIVLTAGLAPTGNNDFYNSIDNFVFFEELLKQGALNFSDGIGIHVDGFSNAPDAECCGTAGQDPQYDESYHFFFSDTLDNYRTILNRNGGTQEAFWLTRFGWGTADNAVGEVSAELGFINLNTADEQAEYTTEAFTIALERGDIGPMILFNLNACAATDNNACFYSVIDSTGAARPVFNSLQAVQPE